MLEDTPVWQTYIADGVQKQWNYTLPYVEDSKIKLYISHDGFFEEVDPTLYTFNRETNVLTYPIGDSPAAPAGDIIALWRETDLTQEEDSSHVAFKSNDVERMVDKLTAICQEIHDQQSRSISYNPAESSPSDITDATYYIHLLERYEEGAEEAASDSRTWAEGTDQQVTPLSGEHSAKGWAKVAKQYAESIDLSDYRTSADQDIIDATKQDTLVSGTNIKTVNGKSLLGSGNVDIDALPSQTGQSGKFLTTDGTDASWATVNALPSQTGQNGKFLTTDGTDASWAKVNIPEGVYTRDNLIEGNGIDFTDVTDIDSDTMLLLHCDGNLTDSSQYASDLYYANESSTISNIITTWNNTSKFGEKSLKLYYSSNSVKPIMRNPIFSSITSAFTLDFWCYFESGSRCYATIFNPSNQNIHFELYYSGGQKIIYFSDSNSHGGRMSSTVSSYANLNAWNHIAITYDGTTAKLFVNGTLAYSGTFTLDLTSGLLGFMPIAPGNTSTYGYPQNLDEIRLSKVLRWSSDFDVPTAPYGQPTGQTKINCGIDNKSVSLNSGDKIQTVGVIDQNDTTKAIKTWTGTRAQYDAIFIKDPDTTYNITDDTVLTDFANTSLSNLTNAGKIVGAGLGMPSGRYIDLTLGASDTTYTAPADGWVIVAKRCGNTGNNYMGIYSDTVLYHMENWAPASANGDAMCCIFFPVKKGHTFPITYSCTGATEVFRFIYAEGSKSEAN